MENILDMTEEELEAELLRQLEEMPSSDEEPEEQQQQIDTLAVSRGKLLSAPDENTPPQASWNVIPAASHARQATARTTPTRKRNRHHAILGYEQTDKKG